MAGVVRRDASPPKDLSVRKLHLFSWTQGGAITAKPHEEAAGIRTLPGKSDLMLKSEGALSF